MVPWNIFAISRLDCDSVGVHPNNRGGSSPNFQYVHGSLYANIIKDGFDPKRAIPGIVIKCDEGDAKKKLIEYNEGLAQGNDLCPPVVKTKMCYGTLASSHLTLGLRCFKNQMNSRISGCVFSVPSDDEFLKQVVDHGHLYYVLDSSLSQEDAEFLSEWRNSDQNQNQGNSEAQLIRNLQRLLLEEMAKNGPQVSPTKLLIGGQR